MNEVLVVVLGLLAGILTVLTIELRRGYPRAKDSNFIYEIIRRLDEYERLGVITSEEKDRLLAEYKERFSPEHVNITQKIDLSSLKQELIMLLDQRIAEINAKIDNIAKMRDDKSRSPIQTQMNSNDLSIEDEKRELEDIKQRIFDTLSKLEKAEVE